METLIIHHEIYEEMGDEIIKSLLDADVELFLDKKIASRYENIEEATAVSGSLPKMAIVDNKQ